MLRNTRHFRRFAWNSTSNSDGGRKFSTANTFPGIDEYFNKFCEFNTIGWETLDHRAGVCCASNGMQLQVLWRNTRVTGIIVAQIYLHIFWIIQSRLICGESLCCVLSFICLVSSFHISFLFNLSNCSFWYENEITFGIRVSQFYSLLRTNL